jgi:Cu(I)/Ag(I) efflux system membrane protein CusA/SilA
VIAEPVMGKGYLEIVIDRTKAARYGVNIADIQDTIEIALGGKIITQTVEGRERFPVRLRYARDFREDEESVKRLLIASRSTLTPLAGAERGMPSSPLSPPARGTGGEGRSDDDPHSVTPGTPAPCCPRFPWPRSPMSALSKDRQ